MNQTACYVIVNAIAEGNASALFTTKGIEEDGYLAWLALVMKYNGRG